MLAAIAGALAIGAPPALAEGPNAIVSSAACSANTLPANDDASTNLVPIGFTLNFFGQQETQLYVNNNGNVTFDAALTTFTPFPLTTTARRIIAPYFADVDTRGAGSQPVRFGYGQTFFQGHSAFCVNWVNVGYYSGGTDKLNSFQLLLVDRADTGVGNFDIVMNFDKVQWETGGASGGSGGLGGNSARTGFSNGVDRSFEQPGSGTNGALLDSNIVSGLTRNSQNSNQLGRYVFPVRNGTTTTGRRLTGRVINTNGNQGVDNAYVSACRASGECSLTTTSNSGAYSFGDLANGTYTVRAQPPGSLLPAEETVTINGVDATRDILVSGPTPPPAGSGVSPVNNPGAADLPVVYWQNDLTLTTQGCANATASYTVDIDGEQVRSGTLAQTTSGHYSGTVPSFYPLHGAAHIEIRLTGCANPSTVEFDIYIDPSGTVKDTNGNPIPGATVTLYRSNIEAGPFDAVPNGSAIMAPSNRDNPDTTDAQGRYGWDVIAGYYRVRAQKAGCHAVGSQVPYTESSVLTIPPAVTDLTLTLDCGTADLRRMITNATVGGVQYASVTECDAATSTAKARPFTVQWSANGTKRFTTSSYQSIACSDAPGVSTPAAGFDTQTGSALGKVNGVSGYKLTWKAVDGGGGANADHIDLTVTKVSTGAVQRTLSGTPASGKAHIASPPTPATPTAAAG